MMHQVNLSQGAGAALLLIFSGLAQAAPATPWQEIKTLPGTLCARGTPYSIFVRPGSPQKLVVDFAGGGACGDAQSCDVESSTFVDSVDGLRQLVTSGAIGGVFDEKRPNNPYKGWTHVLIPYCTGDLHWGAADVTYTRDNGSSFVIHHHGAANAQAAINWIKAHVPGPDHVLVTGCSAGSYGSVFWTPKLRQLYPEAVMQQFGDSGAGIQEPDQIGTFGLPSWNITASAPAWVPGLDPAKVDFLHLTVNDLYLREAGYYRNVQFAQVNHAFDEVQRRFFAWDKAKEAEWTPLMFKAIASLSNQLTNFHAYTAPGSRHCVLPDDEFYQLETGGVRFSEWFSNYLRGGTLTNVMCPPGQCGAPAQAAVDKPKTRYFR